MVYDDKAEKDVPLMTGHYKLTAYDGPDVHYVHYLKG